MEEFIAVFNHGGYAAAAGLLEDAMRNLSDPSVRRTLGTLKALVQAYAFETTRKNCNDLAAIFAEPHAMTARLNRHYDQFSQLARMKALATLLVEDLWRNAQRRSCSRAPLRRCRSPSV